LEAKGIDGNKKVNGRKRHIAVDVLGLVIACMITSANTSDISAGRDIANKLCDNHNNPRMQKIVADSAYKSLQASTGGIKVDISEKDPNVKGFIPVRHRWIVERTFAWMYRQRRLCKDYEVKPKHQKSMVYLGMIRIMLNRLI